jgi:hypothetical protein
MARPVTPIVLSRIHRPPPIAPIRPPKAIPDQVSGRARARPLIAGANYESKLTRSSLIQSLLLGVDNLIDAADATQHGAPEPQRYYSNLRQNVPRIQQTATVATVRKPSALDKPKKRHLERLRISTLDVINAKQIVLRLQKELALSTDLTSTRT